MEWQTITKMSEWSKRDALNLQLPETRINGSLDVAERDVLHSEQMFWQITYALHANKIETLKDKATAPAAARCYVLAKTVLTKALLKMHIEEDAIDRLTHPKGKSKIQYMKFGDNQEMKD